MIFEGGGRKRSIGEEMEVDRKCLEKEEVRVEGGEAHVPEAADEAEAK